MDKQGYNIFLLTFFLVFKSERFLKASLLQKKKKTQKENKSDKKFILYLLFAGSQNHNYFFAIYLIVFTNKSLQYYNRKKLDN